MLLQTAVSDDHTLESQDHNRTTKVTHAAHFFARQADDSLATRLDHAKRSFITRRIKWPRQHIHLQEHASPTAGDLVLARIDKLGHHKRLEDPHGRRRYLYVGDEVLLCYAPRYATDQFEAVVPETLEPCQMVAAGGIAAKCLSRHTQTRQPTQITPLGLITRANGKPINLKDFAAHPISGVTAHRPRTIAVLGTAMNSGKTTTAAAVVKNLAANGQKVGVGKITGTGSGGDRWKYTDAGADTVLDFSDMGYASTCQLTLAEIEGIAQQLVTALTQAGADTIVLEVADGIFFADTARFTQSTSFQRLVDDVMLTANDCAGAVAGEQWLKGRGINPIALAGTLTSSPLATREARQMLATPLVTLQTISQGKWDVGTQR